jgi:hypothetical protein
MHGKNEILQQKDVYGFFGHVPFVFCGMHRESDGQNDDNERGHDLFDAAAAAHDDIFDDDHASWF